MSIKGAHVLKDTANTCQEKKQLKKTKNDSGFTLRFVTDNGPELLFALNPESEQRRFLVMIGQMGVTLDAEDAAALLLWLSSHRDDVNKAGKSRE
jgi:hypothetical protein